MFELYHAPTLADAFLVVGVIAADVALLLLYRRLRAIERPRIS